MGKFLCQMNSDALDIFEHVFFCRFFVACMASTYDHTAGAHRRRGLLSVELLLDRWCPRGHRSQMGQTPPHVVRQQARWGEYPWPARGGQGDPPETRSRTEEAGTCRGVSCWGHFPAVDLLPSHLLAVPECFSPPLCLSCLLTSRLDRAASTFFSVGDLHTWISSPATHPRGSLAPEALNASVFHDSCFQFWTDC